MQTFQADRSILFSLLNTLNLEHAIWRGNTDHGRAIIVYWFADDVFILFLDN